MKLSTDVCFCCVGKLFVNNSFFLPTCSAVVLYEDFLDALERATAAEGKVSLSASLRHSTTGFVNGSGFDGLRSSANNNTHSNNSNEGWEDDLKQFRRSVAPANHYNDYPVELEEGSDSAYGMSGTGMLALSPPKVSDSLSFSRNMGGARMSSPSRYHRSSVDDSPRGSYAYKSSILPARSSPSKVGSKMWGSDTPLAKKGKALNVGEGNWCCAVCLYVENSVNSATCAVCDSPNYTVRKVR